MDEVAIFELNREQQSVLQDCVKREVLNEICLKQSNLLDMVNREETCNFKYQKVLFVNNRSLSARLDLKLTKFTKSDVTITYNASIDVPYYVVKYVIEI